MAQTKTCLPSNWTKATVGKYLIEQPKSKIQVSDALDFGQIPFFTSGESILRYNEKLVSDENIFLATGGVANIKYFWGDASYSTDTYVVKANKINCKFLYYYLLNNIDYINNNFFSGSGLKHLQKKDLKNFSIFLPTSPEEQKTIANVLSTIDKAIEETETLIEKYTKIKIGLMQELLTRGIDKKGNIRSEKTHKFKDSPLGKIPVEWECTTIGEIVDYLGSGVTPTGGSEVYTKSGIMLIRSQNVYPYGFKLDDVAYITDEINNKMKRSELRELDVLLNITGASIGRSTFVPVGFPKANVNQHVCAIRLKSPSVKKSIFLSAFLNSEYGQNQINKLNAGSNRQGLNYNQIRSIKIPYFNSEYELRNFSNTISTIDCYIERQKKNMQKLRLQKNGLMTDLISGKVQVTNLMK